MLFEYKIQKVVDGNGDESFNILIHYVLLKKWWKKKLWKDLDTYSSRGKHNSLSSAQKIVKLEMEADAKKEYRCNKDKLTVVKEYTYTEIPNHIPEEQQENFCDLKGATT